MSFSIGELLVMQVDMSEQSQVEALVTCILADHKRIDIFVNNAARFVFAHATEVTEEGAALSYSLSHWTLLNIPQEGNKRVKRVYRDLC